MCIVLSCVAFTWCFYNNKTQIVAKISMVFIKVNNFHHTMRIAPLVDPEKLCLRLSYSLQFVKVYIQSIAKLPVSRV